MNRTNMATALTVQEVVSGNTYDVAVAQTGVSREEEVTTAAAFLGFIDEKVRNDVLLTDDQSEKLRLRLSGHTNANQAEAEQVGKRIRDIGDEFIKILRKDAEVEGIVNSIVADTDGNETPETAYDHFRMVVRGVFECTADGRARTINLGRIAGVFSYCYRLVTAAAQRYRDISTVRAFFGNLFNYLLRFFVETGFYGWLESIGGWGQLLVQTYDWVSKSRTRTVIAAVVVLSVMGFVVYNALM